jgi:hypothetical protein
MTLVWHWFEGDDFFLQEGKSVSLSNESKVGDVAPVHLMEVYRSCVGIAPLILSQDFIWICVVGIMQLFGESRIDSRQCLLTRRLAGRFEETEFISLYGNGISKECNAFYLMKIY